MGGMQLLAVRLACRNTGARAGLIRCFEGWLGGVLGGLLGAGW